MLHRQAVVWLYSDPADNDSFLQRCPECSTPAQLAEACNHMTCANHNCRTDFCYICGGKVRDSGDPHFGRRQPCPLWNQPSEAQKKLRRTRLAEAERRAQEEGGEEDHRVVVDQALRLAQGAERRTHEEAAEVHEDILRRKEQKHPLQRWTGWMCAAIIYAVVKRGWFAVESVQAPNAVGSPTNLGYNSGFHCVVVFIALEVVAAFLEGLLEGNIEI